MFGLKIRRPTMSTLKLTSVIFVSLLLAAAACENDEARLIATTCGALKRYFTLSEDDYSRCLSNADYGKALVPLRDIQWSQKIPDSHNQKLMIMLPARDKDKYIRVSQIMDLPLKQAGSVGERYVIPGTLLDETDGTNRDGTDKHVLEFYADTDNDRKHRVVIATDALHKDIKVFISRHCWLNTAEYSTSMCHGDVYISVQREPTRHFITYELDGAIFTKSNAAAVVSLLSRHR